MTAPGDSSDGAGPDGVAPLRVALDVEAFVGHALTLHPDAAVVAFDHELRIVAAAGDALLQHGWAPSMMVGRTLADLVGEPVLSMLLPLYLETIAGGAPRTELVSPLTGRIYDQRFSPVRGAAGDVVGGVTLWEDITARRQIERDLADSEARYRLLAERSSDVIVVIDRQLRFQYVSQAVTRLAGWAPDELIGQEMATFVHPDDISRELERGDELLAGRPADTTARFRLRRKGGGWVWIEAVDSPILDPDTGEVVAVQSSGRDISARLQAELLFRATAELAPVGIFRASADGEVDYVNPRWSEIAGTDAATAVGTGWHAAVHPDDLAAISTAWSSRRNGERPYGVGFRFLHADGTVRHVVTDVAALSDESGVVVGYVGSVTDVTDLRQAESERLALEAKLQHAQKLESLAVLAGGVAHDFNNLLVAVLGNAALALTELAPGSPARSSIEQVELAARRASDLTRQMLAYSGKGRLLIEPVDLAGLVRETVQLLAATLGPGVALRVDLAHGLPRIEGDRTQIHQVVMNLVVNAGEAIGGAGGVVSVSVELVELGLEAVGRLVPGTEIEPGRYLALTVADDGAGMPPETRARIFEPFFSTKFTGRGLGLAATLGIVRGHRGGLAVESAEDGGTTFTIYLPPLPADQRLATVPAASASHGAGLDGTVLLVEDDDLVRGVTRRMLEVGGLRVIAVADGAAALAAVSGATAPFFAIVLDLSLPGMPPAELMPALRAACPGAPIVLTSGHDEEEALLRIGEPAHSAFLQKPFTPDELLAALRDATGG